MGLTEILRALGLSGPEQVQPDVSASTILHMLIQTKGRADRLLLALGALYEDVQVLERDDTVGADHITADLWRDGQPYATLACTQQPSATGAARRLQCIFHYWDDGARVNAFLAQAAHWAEAEVGHMRPEVNDIGQEQFTATAPTRKITIQRLASGDDSEALLILLADF